MSKQVKALIFVVMVALIGFAIYWFGFRKKSASDIAAQMPTDPLITAARNKYEQDMLVYLKTNPEAKVWYDAIRTDNGKNLLALAPADSKLLDNIRFAAQGNSNQFIHTENGVKKWAGSIMSLYGF